MTEETKAEATMIETKGQADESQPQQQEEQQKTTETQPQRVEDTATTTTEEVICLANSKMIVMSIDSIPIYNIFQVPGDSQPAQNNQVSLIIHDYYNM